MKTYNYSTNNDPYLLLHLVEIQYPIYQLTASKYFIHYKLIILILNTLQVVGSMSIYINNIYNIFHTFDWKMVVGWLPLTILTIMISNNVYVLFIFQVAVFLIIFIVSNREVCSGFKKWIDNKIKNNTYLFDFILRYVK